MVAPLWSPSSEQRAGSAMERFRGLAETAAQRALPDYPALLDWSIEQRDVFWSLLWDHAGIIGRKGSTVARGLDDLTGTEWFPDARINFAENLLVRDDDAPALVARDETGADRILSWRTLNDDSARVAAHLKALGVAPGDRVAGVLVNGPEAVVAMLATTRLGAIWSSCSPDFGADAIVDRFAQIEPRVLFGCSDYRYAGRVFDCTEKLEKVAQALPNRAACIDVNSAWQSLGAGRPLETDFVARRFSDPVYVMFSSGTTGPPKCIVHSIGGALLTHRKEHLLHCNLGPGQRLFFHTTCGWMMWNWLIGALASGATACLYDGAPTHPDPATLFRFVEDAAIGHLGISPGFVAAVANAGYRPSHHHRLGGLASILCTGSPLSGDGFRWLAENVAPVRISSITGGTDILGCFALGNPTLPVYAGEIQCVGLGLDVAFVDGTGRALPEGKGELVCRRSFPSMPIGFWNDPDGAKYRAAYFEAIPGVWRHGDFGEFTEHGGIVIHGRSDAVLNRGGVRIGTAEIYRCVERLPEVLECIAVGRDRDGDLELLLFVRLRDDTTLSSDLEAAIRAAIRAGASPRHVPDRIFAVPDVPRTRSGKLVELAVRDVVHGRPVKNVGAIANPEALAFFADLPGLDGDRRE